MSSRNTRLSEKEIQFTLAKFGLYLKSSYSNYVNLSTELEALCEKNHINIVKMYQFTNKRKRQYKCEECRREELLEILKKYSVEVGFPTQRAFNTSNGLPSYSTYIEFFGSFKNAILESGIEIPKDRERYFNREKLSDQEMLSLLRYYTKEKLKANLTLLTYDDIDGIPNMPHSSCYASRFGTLDNAYKLIGYDREAYNRKMIEDDMKRKFLDLTRILGRTPNSRDIDAYSKKGLCYAMKTYETYFGSLYKLQLGLGVVPTGSGIIRNLTNDELIENLRILGEELGRVPTVFDIENKYLYSYNNYAKRFGSFENALIRAEFKSYNRKIFISESGIKCFSYIEFLFVGMLEKYGFIFKKETLYSKYIVNFSAKIKFDFVLEIDEKKYFVEIFGIEGNKTYDEKCELKRRICLENGLPLIEFKTNEIHGRSARELKYILFAKIAKVNNLIDNISIIVG